MRSDVSSKISSIHCQSSLDFRNATDDRSFRPVADDRHQTQEKGRIMALRTDDQRISANDQTNENLQREKKEEFLRCRSTQFR